MDSESSERTAGGVLGKIVGKAKAAAGTITGNDDLRREGNLQEARSDAEIEAEREREAPTSRPARPRSSSSASTPSARPPS